MRRHHVTIFEFNPKSRVGQRLSNDAFHLNGFFFRQGGINPVLSKGWRIVQKRSPYCNAQPPHALSPIAILARFSGRADSFRRFVADRTTRRASGQSRLAEAPLHPSTAGG